MTFLLALSVSFLIDGHMTKRPRDFVVGGFVGGLAAATKYNALLLIVPLMASYLINIADERERRLAAALDPRLFLYGIPGLIAFAIGVPFLAFDLPGVINGMKLLNESMETGGHGLDLSSGWVHHLEYSLRYGLGLPLTIAAVTGTFAVIALEPRAGLLLLSFPIAYYLVAGSVRNLFFRYAIPMVPFLCVAAARLVTLAARAVTAKITQWRGASADAPRNARVEQLAVAIAAVLVIAPSAYNVFRFDRIISRTDNRVVVARWFDRNVPAGSSVLMSGSHYGYVQFNRAMNYNAWVWDRNRHIFVNDLNRRPAVGEPDWILLQESPLPSETQPVVNDFLNKNYAFVKWFEAFSPNRHNIYDIQDAFFAPFAGFNGVERPGPNYRLYKRVSAP